MDGWLYARAMHAVPGRVPQSHSADLETESGEANASQGRESAIVASAVAIAVSVTLLGAQKNYVLGGLW